MVPDAPPPPTPRPAIDAALRELRAAAPAWAATGPRARAAVLDRLLRDTAPLAGAWAAAAARAKGVAPDSRAGAEEWFTFATLLRTLRLLRRTFAGLAAGRDPARPPRLLAGGRLAVPTFPAEPADRLLFPGIRGEVWLGPPDPERSGPPAGAAALDRGRVVAVLGGGNATAIGPSDALEKVFLEGSVVALKIHPITEFVGPLLEQGFRALLAAGCLRLVVGGVDEGRYLTAHDLVDELHLTGSHRTYETIVFGPGEDGARRRRERRPRNLRPFTAELGNVSPVIVVPGPWTAGDLAYQAEHLVSTMVINAGFFCLATRVIVQHAAWPLRQALLEGIRRVLDATPTRPAYYPGSETIHARFLAAHPDAELHGGTTAGHLPWTFLPNLDAAADGEPCFAEEPFCGLFAETALEAASTAEFVDRAVAFCNRRLWGSLTATLLVHPASRRDPAVAAAIERAVADLRYGTVGVNLWGIYNYVGLAGTWGAFPGHPPWDIQSGRGVVHNLALLPRPEKTVIRGPFRLPFKPLNFPTNRSFARVARLLVAQEASPSWLRLARIALAALRG